ncbi:Uncharacterised protein [Neisseria flavescens]|nr:Uncharacterised protein [Neisseria meningitidis]STZ66208.1 Uncharacterised protein [Neisseria flavescens]
MGFDIGGYRQLRHGSGRFRNIAGEGFQEGNDVFSFFRSQSFTQLSFCHDVDGFIQFPNAAVVEVWIGTFNVSQAGNTEEEFVFGFLGYVRTAFVVFRIVDVFPVRAIHQTEFLEHGTAPPKLTPL